MHRRTIWLLTEQVGGDETAPQHALGAFSSAEAARLAVQREVGFHDPPGGWVTEPWGGGRDAQVCAVAWISGEEVVPLVFRVVPFFLDQPCADVGVDLLAPVGVRVWH
jgi:hypothetical protein